VAQMGEEVLKEFVRRVNALLDRLQKAAGLGHGAMNQADLDVLAVASAELLNKHLRPTCPNRCAATGLGHSRRASRPMLPKKRERIEHSIQKGSAVATHQSRRNRAAQPPELTKMRAADCCECVSVTFSACRGVNSGGPLNGIF